MRSETLAEIQRLCRLVASTDGEAAKYTDEIFWINKHEAFEFVVEWQAITIYHSKNYYIVVYHAEGRNELYKLIRDVQ